METHGLECTSMYVVVYALPSNLVIIQMPSQPILSFFPPFPNKTSLRTDPSIRPAVPCKVLQKPRPAVADEPQHVAREVQAAGDYN